MENNSKETTDKASENNSKETTDKASENNSKETTDKASEKVTTATNPDLVAIAAQIEEEGYVNGSDLLLKVGGKAVGHCTSHTLTFNSETKERAVKPEASKGKQSGLWKNKGVTGLSVSISFEGLRFYKESENGYDEIAAQWGKGSSVEVEAFHRGSDTSPYFKGQCIIDSLEETSPAQDDATYSGQMSNDGEPDVYPGKESA